MRRLVLHEREREERESVRERERGQMYINRSCLKQLSKVKDYNFSPEKKRNTIHIEFTGYNTLYAVFMVRHFYNQACKAAPNTI